MKYSNAYSIKVNKLMKMNYVVCRRQGSGVMKSLKKSPGAFSDHLALIGNTHTHTRTQTQNQSMKQISNVLELLHFHDFVSRMFNLSSQTRSFLFFYPLSFRCILYSIENRAEEKKADWNFQLFTITCVFPFVFLGFPFSRSR